MSSIDVSRQPIRPSRWWYLLVPLALVLGTVGAVQAGIREFRDVDDRFTRVGSDGVAKIELEAGEHASVWAIYEDGRSTSSMDRGAIRVEVVGPGDEQVEFERASSDTTFAYESMGGIRAGDFEADEAGTYEVNAAPTTPNTVADAGVTNLDVGAAAWNVVRPVLLGMAAAFGILVALLVMRSRAKRRLREQPQAAPVSTSASTQGPISFE